MQDRALSRIFRVAALSSVAALGLTACGSDDAPPAAPSGVTAQAGTATSVHVMWRQAPESSGITAYEVYRGKTKVKDVPADQSMVDITGLDPSTPYTFTVRAKDGDGTYSPHSAARSATTPAAVPEDKKAPSRPAGLTAKSDGPRGALLTWTGLPGDEGVTSYDIYQGGSKIHSVAGGATSARITWLRPGTHYSFTLAARDAADNTSPVSRSVEVTTPKGPGDDPDTAPTAFRAETHAAGGAYYVDLSWVAPETGAEVTTYEIYLDGTFATTLIWGGEPPKGRATYSVFVGKKAGDAYRVKLRAKLPDGKWGRFSEERSVVTGKAS
ncbi:fibronectin type III domain-containing protein [Streptomyces liangshanensis]|uniref:Fibronectin type III domain-containing protein n=1 Tax=Streptomyces liangshanensis TaxID=2717324 RepID=A0A6G9GSF8_9ACTN|nr:fibronectin type III domain-containing protein [Streptomyces liangshanensis]QIQ01140.1 fibronectin type III domain-containing protein [Streptomyces liangshanensis]